MGPKVAAVADTAVLKDGCNLLYIRCQLPGEKFLSISLNLNCRVDIIMDTAKHAMLKEADNAMTKIKVDMSNPDLKAPPVVEGQEAAPVPDHQETLDRIMEIIESVQKLEGLESIELQDSAGAVVGVKDLLGQNGKEALKPAHKYVLGRNADDAFVAL
jgi:hypothetical protein